MPVRLRATAARRSDTALDWWPRSAASASASSCSARSGAATARATGRWRRWPSALGVPCVATGNVHSHHPDRARLQDAFVAARLLSTLDQTEPQRRGNGSSAMAPPAEMAARFAEHPGRGGGDRPARGADRVRPHPRPRLPLSRLARSGGRPQPDRAVPGEAGGALSAAPREQREAADRLEEELRVIRTLGLCGFFLLHHDMLELARDVAAEVRGSSAGPPAAAARARPRLERQLDRLLPDRPLAHRPDPQPALPGALPARGDHLAARHRPRLPARHPREADPARARALRHRARGAGGGVRDVPLEGRDPRPRQGARPAGGRDRAGRALGRRVRGHGRLPARRRGGDRARGARPRSAGGR